MLRTALALAPLALVAAACGSSPPTPTCAPGQFLDPNTQTCVTSGVGPQCPPGQVFDGARCVAQANQTCPPGQTWNGSQCVGSPPPQCPSGQTPGANGACVPTGGGGPTGGGAVAGCNGAAQSIPVESIPGGADQLLKAAAAPHVPAGSRPVGSPIAGNFQTGQCLEMPIQVEAGKCYTVVGGSVGGVTDLDLELVPGVGLPGMPTPPLAQDQTDGPQAVLGGKPNCWTAMLPGPMKLVVRVAGGQGMAGAQIYAR